MSLSLLKAARVCPALRTVVTAACMVLQLSSSYAQTSAPDVAAPSNVPLTFEQMRVPRWLVEIVVRAAQVTNVDPAYLMALADKESSFLTDSKARTSSAEGLFQFVEGTWLEVLRRFGPKHGYRAEAKAIHVVQGRPVVANNTERELILRLRCDPYLSALMTGELSTTHRQIRAGTVARDPAFAELYMAYALSVNGASRFTELLRDRPNPSEAVSARRHGPRVSSRAADE